MVPPAAAATTAYLVLCPLACFYLRSINRGSRATEDEVAAEIMHLTRCWKPRLLLGGCRASVATAAGQTFHVPGKGSHSQSRLHCPTSNTLIWHILPVFLLPVPVFCTFRAPCVHTFNRTSGTAPLCYKSWVVLSPGMQRCRGHRSGPHPVEVIPVIDVSRWRPGRHSPCRP